MNTTTIETVDSTQVESQVFLAIEDDMYLPLGEKVLLEMLARDDDGIFPNEKSWRAFIMGNFADGAGGGGAFWLDGDCKKSTIKKWCYDEKEYKHRFVQRIARDTYARVPAEDIELEFTFSTNFYSENDRALPSRVEIYVEATFKET